MAATKGMSDFVNDRTHVPQKSVKILVSRASSLERPLGRKAESATLKPAVPAPKLPQSLSQPNPRQNGQTPGLRDVRHDVPLSRDRAYNAGGVHSTFDATDLSDIDTTIMSDETLEYHPAAVTANEWPRMPGRNQRQNGPNSVQDSPSSTRYPNDVYSEEESAGCADPRGATNGNDQRHEDSGLVKDYNEMRRTAENLRKEDEMIKTFRRRMSREDNAPRHGSGETKAVQQDAHQRDIFSSAPEKSRPTRVEQFRSATVQVPSHQAVASVPSPTRRGNTHEGHRRSGSEESHLAEVRRVPPVPQPWKMPPSTAPNNQWNGTHRQVDVQALSRPRVGPRLEASLSIPPTPARPSTLQTPPGSTDPPANTYDFPPAELNKIPYSTLAGQSLDFDPKPPSTASLPAKYRDLPLAERLMHVAKLPKDQQSAFFASLTAAQWEECGEWFVGRFGNLVGRIAEARRKKREVISGFERRLQERDEIVLARKDETERALKGLRRGGEGLLRGDKGK
ncbi:MAG: hypothetical protein M1825_003620 [Sarcosagium campestre]|nr:MAG: hypothetical protein M1825_003620 [Sarcosagium campestre]